MYTLMERVAELERRIAQLEEHERRQTQQECRPHTYGCGCVLCRELRYQRIETTCGSYGGTA